MTRQYYSTYARMLKPGQQFWTRDNYKTYTVERLEITIRPEVYMVRVYVEGRKSPLIFGEQDRVNFDLAQQK